MGKEYPVCGRCGSKDLEFERTTITVWSKEKQTFEDVDGDDGYINDSWCWCNNCNDDIREIWKEIEE